MQAAGQTTGVATAESANRGGPTTATGCDRRLSATVQRAMVSQLFSAGLQYVAKVRWVSFTVYDVAQFFDKGIQMTLYFGSQTLPFPTSMPQVHIPIRIWCRQRLIKHAAVYPERVLRQKVADLFFAMFIEDERSCPGVTAELPIGTQ